MSLIIPLQAAVRGAPQGMPRGQKSRASLFSEGAFPMANNEQDKRPRAPKKANTDTVSFRVVASLQRGANDAVAVPHRGPIPLRLVVNAFGQLLYRVGFETEYVVRCFWRGLRRATAGARRWAVLAAKTVAAPFGLFFRTMWRDLSAPFVHLAHGMRHLKAEKQAGSGTSSIAFIRSGVQKHRAVLAGALGYLLPVGALAILVFTVSQVLGANYSLAVEYKGDIIGFVENENVWEAANSLVRERIIASDETDQAWNAEPVFTIRAVDKAALSSASYLADTIVKNSSDEIQNATGIHVNGQLVGVVTDGAALQQVLDDTLAPYETGGEFHRVAFAQEIELVPGIYYTSSIEDISAVTDALRADPTYLQVKITDREEYDDVQPYETITQESDDYYEGTQRVLQRGRNGRQHVVADVTRVNGEEVAREVVETTVLEEMTPRIVVVGTKSYDFATSVGHVGLGSLSFPVPGYSYITTRFGQGRHRGTDICVPAGTPIYACAGGTVVEAGWHYSWGNYVRIDHGGYYTLYAHCSQLSVSAGQAVAQGQLVGLVGNTGNSSGNHCHLELWLDNSGSYYSLTDPLNYMTP